MSDKIKGSVKVSVRIPKNINKFIERTLDNSQFSSRSDFINNAIDYFSNHLKTLKSFELNLDRKPFSSMNESKIHLKLKNLAWSILYQMKCKSIEYEKAFIIERKRIILDVYGIGKNGERIAVECWVTCKGSEKKFKLIQKHFDHFIVLTPNDLIDFYEDLLNWHQHTLNNVSAKFKVPLVQTQRTEETTVEFIDANDRVGKELLPLKAIEKELLDGNMAIIKGVKMRTIEVLHKKLRQDLKNQIKEEFRIYSKTAVNNKGETVWLVELRKQNPHV